MPRIMVALLAAVAAAMAVLAPLAHGYLLWLVLAIVVAAAGLVGFTTAPDPPISPAHDLLALIKKPLGSGQSVLSASPRSQAVRRARSGQAIGLAFAARPAGPTDAPGSTARRGRVPRSGDVEYVPARFVVSGTFSLLS
jgi:hypothetical protein